MKQHNRKLVQAVKQALIPRTPGKVSGAAACAGMLFALGPGVGAAADATSESLEEITVTGIRASIATAIAMKEQSNDIIETISAEDLGKLPDLSIADSLARLPGLAAQRTDGRSNFISIRGFAADFSGTTFSGREQASSGENRGVEFDQYPAELINSVEVYKTPDASLIGQGLAGTVNLNTIKPLNSNELKMAFNARGERGSFDNLNPGQGIGRSGSRLSFSIVDQFLDHTLGVAFGVARLDSPIQEKQYQAWYWGRNNGPPGSNTYQGQGWAGPVAGDPDFALSEEGNQARAKSESQLRTGLMSVLEWAPNEHFHSQLDLFYSKFNEKTSLNGLQWSSSPWDGISYSNVQTTPSGGQNVLTSGTVDGIKPIMQNEYTTTDTNNFSAGWNNRFELAHSWTLVADLSFSSAHDYVHDAYAFTGPQSVVVNGIKFNIPIGGGYPNLNVPYNLADPALVGFTDPDNYSYNGREEWDRQRDTIKAVRLDVKHPLGWIFKSVDVGFDYSDRKKIKTAAVYFAYLNGNGCGNANPACAPYNNAQYTPINPALLYAPTSLAYAGVPGVVNYNVLGALSRQFYLVQDQGTNDYNRNYGIEEKVPLGYVKLDIDTNVAGAAVRGNVGVQFVHTTQSTSGLITDPNNNGQLGGAVSTTYSYNEVLPSLNLVGEFGNRNYLRLAVSRSMMRGRIDDEKSAASASVPTQGPAQWNGSGGNPYLKPYVAIGEDLSFEKIFGKASYFSAALFNKNLTSYVFTQTNPNYNFAGYTTTGRQPDKQFNNLGPFSLPENGSGGKIQGYEIALVLEGGLLTRFLDGFGLQSNFAYTNNYIPSNILGMVPGGPTTFPGFSKKVGALTLYYEKYGASVRIAETYRSPFTGEVVGNFDQLGYTQIETDRTINFQAGYEFKDGVAKGLSFLLQVNNVSNSPYKTVQITSLPAGGSFSTPLEYDTFGRTYLLGVNYKL
jgi:iron complex outermembrane receptor protein